MSDFNLKKLVREALKLQIKVIVGNKEKAEVWKQMKEHFTSNLEIKLHEVITLKSLIK